MTNLLRIARNIHPYDILAGTLVFLMPFVVASMGGLL